jgi:glycosidase
MSRPILPLILSLLFTLLAPAADTPSWFADAVWYQIFPDRFRNGDPANDPTRDSLEGTWPYSSPENWQPSPWTSDWYKLQPWEITEGGGFYRNTQLRRYGGDIQGIIDQLDYLKNLGVNALYLNPVFDSASLHKYGASRYHHIDRHFGPDPKGDVQLFNREDAANPAAWEWSAADKLFLQLIREVHQRDMRIIIDGVFNHVGIPFWALQKARQEGPSSRFANWFIIKQWDNPNTPQDEFDYQGWIGIKDLPELNRTETTLHPDVRQHLHAVVQRWMDPNNDGNPEDGIDGWRLDVAAEVPMGFWIEFRQWVKSINPNAFITGEIWWEDFQANTFRNARPWLDQAFDSVMNYRFGDAVYQFLNQPQPIPPSQYASLLLSIHSDYTYNLSLNQQNLFSSHDTSRIGSAVVNPQYRQDHGAGVEGNRDYAVRAPNAEEKYRWKQMVALQFLSPGAPYIYYGDEVGMWGADDPDCRKPMLWPDLQYDHEQSHPFNQPRPTNPVQIDQDLLAFYRHWISLRHEMEVLRRGSFNLLLTDDTRRLLAFERALDQHHLIAVFNAGSQTQHVTTKQLGTNPRLTWKLGLTKPTTLTTTPIPVPPHSHIILQTK